AITHGVTLEDIFQGKATVSVPQQGRQIGIVIRPHGLEPPAVQPPSGRSCEPGQTTHEPSRFGEEGRDPMPENWRSWRFCKRVEKGWKWHSISRGSSSPARA